VSQHGKLWIEGDPNTDNATFFNAAGMTLMFMYGNMAIEDRKKERPPLPPWVTPQYMTCSRPRMMGQVWSVAIVKLD